MKLRTALINPELAIPVGSLSVGAVVIFSWGFWSKNAFSLGAMVLMLMGGFLGFTLLEYLIHRYLFHFPAKGERLGKLIFKIHGVHHRYPLDMSKYKSPYYSRPLGVVLGFFLFHFLTGPTVYGWFPGFLLGYAFYLLMHFIVHYCPRPKNWFGIVWIHHDIHHDINSKSAYGVSSPLWDLIIGTNPGKSDYQKWEMRNINKNSNLLF